MDGPRDVLLGIEADVGGHRRDEDVPDALQRPDRDGLALEIPDRADALGPEQLEAADVDSRQEDDGILRVDTQEKRSTERRVEIGLAGGQVTPLRGPGIGRLDVLHTRESLASQQVLGHELRGRAEARAVADAKRRRLRRRLGFGRGHAEQLRHAHGRRPMHERASPDHPFNSFFSSFRNRQSVPCAIRRCGVDLIIPAS
jgi:hypothetical protein